MTKKPALVSFVLWAAAVISAGAGYLFGSFIGSDDTKRGIIATCHDEMRFTVYNSEYVCLKVPAEGLARNNEDLMR